MYSLAICYAVGGGWFLEQQQHGKTEEYLCTAPVASSNPLEDVGV